MLWTSGSSGTTRRTDVSTKGTHDDVIDSLL